MGIHKFSMVLMMGVLTLSACSDNNGSDDPVVPEVPAPIPGKDACVALASAPGVTANGFPANVVVTSAEYIEAVPASGSTAATPAHCNVTGTINARAGLESSPGVPQSYAIQYRVLLPTEWNGDYYMQGGGGLNGSIPNTTAKMRDGYVTASSDSGHDATANADPLAGGAAAFATDPQARQDFGYNALDKTNQVARKFMGVYYGKSQRYAYFEGCSMGGREAMNVSQRLQDQFDGVVSGDPAFKLTTMSTHEIYNAQTLGALATKMGLKSANGLPLIANTFTNQDLQLVSRSVLEACDALDGLEDGMVNKPLSCTSDRVYPALDAKQCAAEKSGSCLSADQIAAIKKIYEGPVTPSGVKTYYPWMWDAGIAGCTSAVDCNTPDATNIANGWRGWKLGSYQTNLVTATTNGNDFSAGAGGGLSILLAPTPVTIPAPAANEGLLKMMLERNLDDHYSSIFATNGTFTESSYSQLQADSTDYDDFVAHGAKLIIYQPQTGGPFSPLAMVDWYERLNQAQGGNPFDYEKLQDSVRMYLVPGMQHCSGGPGTTQFNAFAAVKNWVENGVKPDRIVATAPSNTPWPGRTRPLCPFPRIAKYAGSGSVDLESNFICE